MLGWLAVLGAYTVIVVTLFVCPHEIQHRLRPRRHPSWRTRK